MIDAVKHFVENIIVIILLAAFLQIILPEGGMRRYAQLAVGLIMVLTLLNPLLTLARAPLDLGDLLGQATAQTSWEELKSKGQIFEQQNTATMLASYRQTLTEQVRHLVEQKSGVEVVACQFELVEDRQAEDFGRILQMQVQLAWGAEVVQPVSSIHPVQVGQAGLGSAGQTAAETTKRMTALESTLANHFSLATDQVVVTIK